LQLIDAVTPPNVSRRTFRSVTDEVLGGRFSRSEQLHAEAFLDLTVSFKENAWS
jgi:hypothetical protein